jgi:hypothetical protein
MSSSESEVIRQQLASPQEEADTKLVAHAVHIAQKGFDAVHVLSPDTDVLVLLIAHFPKLPSQTILFTRGSSKRRIDIGKLFHVLGPRKAGSLIGFHAFSGCDQTGRFAGKGKTTCWNAFINAPQNIQDAFFNLGRDSDLSEEMLVYLENYVCFLYRKSAWKNQDRLESLRWKLFCCQEAEGESLPPTKETLRQVALLMFGSMRGWCSRQHSTQPSLAGRNAKAAKD